MITTPIEFSRIPIDKIIEPEWDIRQNTKSDDDSDNNNFAGLVQSVKKDGIINPITVSKNGMDKYEIVAGRRRFKACKMLNLKEIPALVRWDAISKENKSEKQRIALIENLHRKDLSDTEKAEGILSVYTSAGYQSEDVVRSIKYLENNTYQPGKTDINLILGKPSLTKSTIKPKTELMVNEKFIDIVDSIGYSPNTQYKYLQIIVKLDPLVLREAENKGLSINKKIMLTNTTLRKFPEIQIFLIDRIANQSEQVSRIIISETVTQMENNDNISKEKLLETVRKIQKLEGERQEIIQNEGACYVTTRSDFVEPSESLSLKTKELLKKANANKEYQDLKTTLLKQKTKKGYRLTFVKTYVSSNNEIIRVYKGLVVGIGLIHPIIVTLNLTKKSGSVVIDKAEEEKMEQQFNLI